MDCLRRVQIEVEAAAALRDDAQERAIVPGRDVENMRALGIDGLGHRGGRGAQAAEFLRPCEVGCLGQFRDRHARISFASVARVMRRIGVAALIRHSLCVQTLRLSTSCGLAETGGLA